MAWWTWSALAVTYVAVWRWAFRAQWELEIEAEKTWRHFCVNAFVCAVLFWVVGIMGACEWVASHSTPDRAARLVAGESRAAKRRRQKRELAEREQRILRAERELGIAGRDDHADQASA